MRTRFFLGALSPALILLLAGCGATVAANTACQNPAASAPTINQGLVTIATDHSVYATANAIVATVTNGTGQSIYTENHKASCTVLALQQQVNGKWAAPSRNIAGCAEAMVTGVVELAPGKPLTVSVHAGGLRSVAWPAGTYRLVLTYSTSRTDVAQPNNTTVYSQPVTIVDCGAPAATSGSSGTPNTGAQPGEPINVTPKP